MQCDMIFTDLVIPPFTYMWHEDGMFIDPSTNAVYNIIADSDFDYQCRATARNQKGRPVQARSTILLTVRGIYLLWCSTLFSVFVNTPVWNNELCLGLCQINYANNNRPANKYSIEHFWNTPKYRIVLRIQQFTTNLPSFCLPIILD